MRRIVRGPVNRHLDQVRVPAPSRRALELQHVALSRIIRRVVVAHHAAVVLEPVPEHEIDRIRAQIPRRGAVTARILSRNAADRFIAANELLFFLFLRKARGRTVRPAVMRDLVTGIGDTLHGIRESLDRMAGDVPRSLDSMLLEQREQPRRGNAWSELAAGNPAGRGLAARDEARDRVEVERKTDDVFGHGDEVSDTSKL